MFRPTKTKKSSVKKLKNYEPHKFFAKRQESKHILTSRERHSQQDFVCKLTSMS